MKETDESFKLKTLRSLATRLVDVCSPYELTFFFDGIKDQLNALEPTNRQLRFLNTLMKQKYFEVNKEEIQDLYDNGSKQDISKYLDSTNYVEKYKIESGYYAMVDGFWD